MENAKSALLQPIQIKYVMTQRLNKVNMNSFSYVVL